jgi:membrane protease YdiL (CAAX protease family)
MNAPQAGPPFPAPLTAFGLSAAALLVLGMAAAALGGGAVGVALGAVLGYGGLGSLAARVVAPPAELRLGLAPFPRRAAPALALLLPVVLVLSELDNWIRAGFGGKPALGLGQPQLPSAELILISVLLLPVLHEFFFRGVLLQGCASALGRLRGVVLVALLEVMPRVSLSLGADVDAADVTSALIQFTLLGVLLGFVRLATGSLLPGVVLSGAVAALGVAAGAFPDRVAIPGFNAPGFATPLAVLAPALLAVALGLRLLSAQLAAQPPLPPIPPAEYEPEDPPGF